LRGAAKLVVPSQFVARQVEAQLGISTARICVLPLGVDAERFAPGAGPARGDYVLSVGSGVPRKNLELLPDIMRHAARARPGLRLVRVGDPLAASVRREMEAALPGGFEERGRVDDAALAQLYAQAVALVVPSRLEGFGLPVLEAMAAGCPVVSSNAASLPEAGGAAALYFAPDDAATAGRHLAELASDPTRRTEWVERGIARARQFPWSAHVAGLVAIYRELAGSTRAG
jgi:alpha-1,3-rhamnosyl/mannosyltransferase